MIHYKILLIPEKKKNLSNSAQCLKDTSDMLIYGKQKTMGQREQGVVERIGRLGDGGRQVMGESKG